MMRPKTQNIVAVVLAALADTGHKRNNYCLRTSYSLI